jgi:hypothetical protein
MKKYQTYIDQYSSYDPMPLIKVITINVVLAFLC